MRLEWNGKVLTEDVAWFQYESDTSLNSNVYEIAETLVLTHFPGGWQDFESQLCSLLVPLDSHHVWRTFMENIEISALQPKVRPVVHFRKLLN